MKQSPSSGGMRCIVTRQGRRCPNKALPNRRTCGQHGKRTSRAQGRRSRFVHLDCAIPTLADQPTSKRALDYRYPVVERDLRCGLVRVTNLPTNEDELGAFVAVWLQQPGHSLWNVECLTPPAITTWPDQYALSALRLIEHDIPPQPGFQMAFGATVMIAQAVPCPTGGR